MRFLPNGPNVPDELVAAQERGQTIFVCGAGVSRTVGLPLFRRLVEIVYEELGEQSDLHPAEREGMVRAEYDRVLRCLERRLAGSDLSRQQRMRERIRLAVRKALSPPENAELANHLALLYLSRGAEGRTRLLTTNFDTVFERAWFNQQQTRISSHAGPAMPQPKASGFAGVLHLHGRLADAHLQLDETELVLTSAEFGDAYLRSGWASRYVYDLVRTHTLVLVGYQAEDPPMRYLLEALEADRERYPDLQHVYAFASSDAGNDEVTAAQWEAKGVKPILYVAENHDHSALYQALQEWKRYADDPTAWRRERLRDILRESPTAVAAEQIDQCLSLLRHGDATQLLGELSSKAEWLSLMAERRVFDDGKVLPGEWIAKRINDPDMIRACAALAGFDDRTHWLIDRAVGQERQALPQVRLKAWQLMLVAKRFRAAIDSDLSWHAASEAVKQGEVGYDVRQLIARILRPRLEIRKALRAGVEDEGPEDLHHFLRIEFRSTDRARPAEILDAWPHVLDHEVALFRVLERAFVDAVEEASDVGFLQRRDRTSWDVPSVADHPQNAHRSGFYPIIRALADIWQRIAAHDSERARTLALLWKDSPFLLAQRLYLYAVSSSEIFTAKEAASAALNLSDDVFWLSGAQVEIMRLLTGRWYQFSQEDCNALEARLVEGIPRNLFPPDAFENAERWESIRDSAVFKKLKRISAAEAQLSPASLQLLEEISARHPNWQPSSGDRDDFMVWVGETRWGRDGHPELLASTPDEALITEAMRLRRERPLEEGDIWRVFCAADPNRALRAIRLEADVGAWDVEVWQSLLSAAEQTEEADFQFDLADLLVTMPEAYLVDLLPLATSWLRSRWETLAAGDRPEGPRVMRLWDRLAELAFEDDENGAVEDDDDLPTRALNEPGGILGWILLDSLIGSKPKAGSGLGWELTPRFNRVAWAHGSAGLLARISLVHRLTHLDIVDPTWTEQNLASRLAWNHPEAAQLWKGHATDQIGSARLFNWLKPALLEAFQREVLSDHDLGALTEKILFVALSHHQGKALDFKLSTAEIRRALSVGPQVVRRHATWRFWRLMGSDDGLPVDKAERWRTLIGPLFRDIWPLDAKLQNEETSKNLVLMSLDCEDAFPEAVDTIMDVLVPYHLYYLSHSLRLEQKHSALVPKHPAAFVRLVSALINPAVYPLPSDLATFLEECVRAEPLVANEPGYIRLFALRRQMGA